MVSAPSVNQMVRTLERRGLHHPGPRLVWSDRAEVHPRHLGGLRSGRSP
jgi:hypothetical protein